MVGATALASDQTTPQTTPHFRVHVMNRLYAKRGRADMSLGGAEARYKKYFERRVRRMRPILRGRQFFVDRATNATQSPDEEMDEAPHMKLLARSTGPFPVESLTTDMVTIREYGVDITVTIDQVSVAVRGTTPFVHDA